MEIHRLHRFPSCWCIIFELSAIWSACLRAKSTVQISIVAVFCNLPRASNDAQLSHEHDYDYNFERVYTRFAFVNDEFKLGNFVFLFLTFTRLPLQR